MTPFDSLKHSFYQRTPVSPGSPRPGGGPFSDISSHLPVLEYYASLCDHVTEFGVREGCSTVALLAGCRGEVHSYDIERPAALGTLWGVVFPCEWHFHLGDTGSPDLPVAETELLFIDTLHTYEHLTKELLYHGRKARKFLAFHDTFTCGESDHSGPDPDARGILPAIQEFLDRFPGEYSTVYRTCWNNGLWVLARR